MRCSILVVILIGVLLLNPTSVAVSTASEISEGYTNLRELIFNFNPEDLSFPPDTEKPEVWGVVIDENHVFPAKLILTVVTLADVTGTTSVYTSGGGAFLGLGEDKTMAQAARSLRARAQTCYRNLQKTETFPLPEPGRLRIYILTFSGVYFADVGVEEVSDKSHPLHGLYDDYWTIRHKNPLLPSWGGLIKKYLEKKIRRE